MFIAYASVSTYPSTLDHILEDSDKYTRAHTALTEAEALNKATKMLAYVQGKFMIDKKCFNSSGIAFVFRLENDGKLTPIYEFDAKNIVSKQKY